MCISTLCVNRMMILVCDQISIVCEICMVEWILSPSSSNQSSPYHVPCYAHIACMFRLMLSPWKYTPCASVSYITYARMHDCRLLIYWNRKNFILGCCFHLLKIEISVHYSICCVFQWNRHVLNERILDASACSWRTNISKSLESSIDAWAKWMELIFLELTRVLDASFRLSDSSLISIYFSLFLFSLGQTNMSIRGRILT